MSEPSLRVAPRALEAARLRSTGLTNKEVAFLLGISEQTVKNYFSNLYSTFGVTTFEGLLTAMGWVFPGGLTPELIVETLERSAYMQTLRAHEALDAVITEGLEIARTARAVKALLRPDPRAEAKHG